jgi:hypothetical protein
MNAKNEGQKNIRVVSLRGRFRELPTTASFSDAPIPTGLCEKPFLPPIEQLTIGVAERRTTRKIREMDPVSFAFATISMVDICMK